MDNRKMKSNPVLMKWARIVGVAMGLVVLAGLVLAAPSGLRAETDGTNVISNPGFENGATSWTCRGCKLTLGAPADSGAAAQFATTKSGGRVQLWQNGITLQPNTTYELRFWARSSKAAKLQVTLLKQSSPFTNYGLKPQSFNLTPNGQEYTYTFTTSGFNQQVDNARLRFRTDRVKKLSYSVDSVSLVAVDGGGAPTPTPPTPTPPPTQTGQEMLIYDWNKPVTVAEGGFAMDKTSQYLSQNWVQPVNYADGRLHFRVRVYSIPKNQPGMKVGFCFWQATRENCRGNEVAGVPGTVATWDFKLHDMWKKDGVEVDWTAKRKKMGFSIRDSQNDPVSNKTSTNWGGNNPADWYPMDIRVQVVLVPAGASFSGWQNYP